MPASSSHRRLFDVELEPVSGSRFQPTGFPDIGPALFDRPVRENGAAVWRQALIVESAQSMANRLEDVGWDRPGEQPSPTLRGLPYVRVVAADDGRYLTSSRTEAHRIGSAFVKDSTLKGKSMVEVVKERLGLYDDTPLAPHNIATEVFRLDPLCLIHGVFLADKRWPGQPKIARAVTSFIEAIDVRPAISGGVKRDEVRHAIGEGQAGSAEGYGFVPFHRTEYTAARIVAFFSLDLAQIASYGLDEPADQLLEAIALWQIRSLLSSGLRLRTACDLAPVADAILDREGQELPGIAELDARVRQLVVDSRKSLGDAAPLEVVWAAPKKGKKKSEPDESESDS